MIEFDGKPFDLLWKRPIKYLDEPNLRGSGFSAVARVSAADWPEFGSGEDMYIKKQADFYCRPSWNSFRATPTFRREVLFLQRARQAGVNTARILGYGDIADGRVMLILAALPDVADLETQLTAYPGARATIISNVAETLVTLHRACISHGAVYPKHLLIGQAPDFKVTLIDFEKAREMPSAALAARGDLLRFVRRAQFLTAHDKRIIRDAYLGARFFAMRTLLPAALRG